MQLIAREIGHFFVGIMFLTRLPTPAGLAHEEGRLARSARYFPLVGVLIGAITGGVFLAASLVLTPMLAAGVAIGIGMLVTGALHEDGFADCCDGIGGGATREQALEIMKDSRLGTYGAAGLIMSLGLRWVALSSFGGSDGLVALIVAHAVSRGLITPVMVSGHYARSRGLASSVAGGVGTGEASLALVVSLAIALIAGVVPGIAAFAAAAVCGGIMLAILIRKLGGYTGDGLGAVQQICEIAILLTLASFAQ